MQSTQPCLPRPRRQGRLSQACPLTLALAFLAAGCPLSSAEETEEHSVPIKTGQEVRVETRNGRIEVRAGTAGRVKVKALKRARASSKPEALLKDVKVKISRGTDRITVAAEHPSGSLSRQYGVSFEITVPPGTALHAESRNGAIHVAGTGGAVVAETRNGRLSVESATAEARLATRNGAVSLSGRPTRFTLKSGNGAIRVLLDAGVALTGDSSATTKNGSLTLEAPADFRARIEASTHNGKVRSDFPLGGPARTGEPSLRLRTRNGAIRVRKR